MPTGISHLVMAAFIAEIFDSSDHGSLLSRPTPIKTVAPKIIKSGWRKCEGMGIRLLVVVEK